MNAGKTEFIWLGTRHSPAIREAQYVTAADQESGHHAVRRHASDKVRDLGVIIDCNFSKLTMESHTANVVRSCLYQIRQLRSILRSLTVDARRTLATALPCG